MKLFVGIYILLILLIVMALIYVLNRYHIESYVDMGNFSTDVIKIIEPTIQTLPVHVNPDSPTVGGPSCVIISDPSCESPPTEYDELNVNTIGLNDAASNVIRINSNMKVDGSIDTKEFRLNGTTLFTYDEDANVLRFS
jgi:hypothetical protein